MNKTMTSIEKKYMDFMRRHNWTCTNSGEVESIMRDAIIKFMKEHDNVAIYGYGRHTEHLMLDFVGELRDVKIIIDNYFDRGNTTGYRIVREEEIAYENIDGIIMSIYADREQILGSLKNDYPNIEVLDFYMLFEKKQLNVMGTYYGQGQGGASYNRIKLIHHYMESHYENADRINKLRELVGVYCTIKDFRMAEKVASELYSLSKMDSDEKLLSQVREIYNNELELVGDINFNNVYMLCIDGLRRRDLMEGRMSKCYSILRDKCVVFDNAYSYSTSTYESLIPAYSEVSDQRKAYYKSTEIEKGKCRFIERAKSQGKKIVLNTGTGRFFDDEKIEYRSGVMTITQHLWDFVITASQCDNLLYYSQPQCESHFPFYNPYTKNPVLDGTAILFDYLDKYGNNVRTDYEAQHCDAIRYIDDTLEPILKRLNCKFLLYSDHGSITLHNKVLIDEIDKQYFGSHEDWIRIPMCLYDGKKQDVLRQITTLMDINDIVISLLEDKEYYPKERPYVKIGRSEIYNPDFRIVYKKAKAEHYLKAFEGFVFDKGYKLIVYSDGKKELYTTEGDKKIFDEDLVSQLFQMVKEDVTVLS